MQFDQVRFILTTYQDGFYYMKSDTDSWISNAWFIADEGGHVYKNDLGEWVFSYPSKNPNKTFPLLSKHLSEKEFIDITDQSEKIGMPPGLSSAFLVFSYKEYIKHYVNANKWFVHYQNKRLSLIRKLGQELLVPPFILFVFGYLFGWVFRGFKH